jgi:two-component system, LuxR family, response regulator FixJ
MGQIRSTQQIVVVVDDDSQIRESLENLLKAAEFRPAAFSSAESALESGLLAESSCLITDVRLEGMQGPELQRRVKLAYPKLPVIIITGHRDEKMKQGALSGGTASVLYKPLDPDALIQAVHAAIASARMDS